MRPGQRVGKYVLGERIARGGMAEVWAARVEGPQGFVKSVALKFVVDSGDPELERLFVNEARVAAGLQHPNLVTVFDFDRVADDGALEPGGGGPGSSGRSYIAMERIEGHDLRRVMRSCRERALRFPVRLSLYVAGEVLQGLRYIHERPPVGAAAGRADGATLVHRDVSPHNILVSYTGEVKLSDFGIAKVVTRVPGVQSGLVRGKVAYASPEQILGQPVDHQSDQFSLGVTLWELLAGQRLFGGTTDVETMNRVLAGDVPPLPRALDLHPAIEAVVRRMLAAEPQRRFPSTAAALVAVTALPHYSPDGGALGAWMLEQFVKSNVGLPATQPLSRPAPAASAGSTLWMDDGRPRAPSVRRTQPGPEPRVARPAPEVPIVRPEAGATGRRRGPAPHSVPVVIDFATRAPLRSPRPPWARLGVVAALVALLVWGAALGIRQSVRLALVPTPAVRGTSARHHGQFDPAPDPSPAGGDRGAEVIPAPASRSAEIASATPRTTEPATESPSEPEPTPAATSAPASAPGDPDPDPDPAPGDEDRRAEGLAQAASSPPTASIRPHGPRSNGLSPNGAPIIP